MTIKKTKRTNLSSYSSKRNKDAENSNKNRSNNSSRSHNPKIGNQKFNKNLKSREKSREKINSNFSNSKSNKFIDSNVYKNKGNDRYKENNLDDMVWGKHSVYEVLISNKPINRIWCTSEIRSSEKFMLLLKDIKRKGVLIEEVPWSRLSLLTSGAVHQGILLQISYSHTIPLNELIRQAKIKSKSPKIICLDGITDPHNVGAIIRSAEAFGYDGVIIPQRRSAGITGTVAKAAAGALEYVLISRVVNLNRSLEELKDEGFQVAGLSLDGRKHINNFDVSSPLVLVVGSENKGLSLLTQKHCDYLLKIPIHGRTSSLNASVAAAIAMYQFTKANSS